MGFYLIQTSTIFDSYHQFNESSFVKKTNLIKKKHKTRNIFNQDSSSCWLRIFYSCLLGIDCEEQEIKKLELSGREGEEQENNKKKCSSSWFFFYFMINRLISFLFVYFQIILNQNKQESLCLHERNNKKIIITNNENNKKLQKNEFKTPNGLNYINDETTSVHIQETWVYS